MNCIFLDWSFILSAQFVLNLNGMMNLKYGIKFLYIKHQFITFNSFNIKLSEVLFILLQLYF